MNNSKMQSEKESSLTFSNSLLTLAKQIRIVLFTPFIFCVISFFYLEFLAVDLYTSTSKVLSSAKSNSSGGSQASGLAAQFGIVLPNMKNEPIWINTDIIKSRTIAKAMLNRKFDSIKFGKEKTLLDILTGSSNSKNKDLNTLKYLAVDKFISMIGVSHDLKTGIYTVSINGEEQKLVADLNAALIEELDAHQKNNNRKQRSEARVFIEERIFDVNTELINVEEDLKIFMDRNRRIENSPALQLEQQRLLREVTILTGVVTTLKQEYETTKIEEVKESNYVIIIDPPEIPIYRSKPNKKLIMIMTALLSFGFGVLICFLIELDFNLTKKQIKELNEAKSIFKNKINIFKLR